MESVSFGGGGVLVIQYILYKLMCVHVCVYVIVHACWCDWVGVHVGVWACVYM